MYKVRNMELLSVWQWFGLFVAAISGVALNLSTQPDVTRWIRRHWEALLIRLAARILISRNVARSLVVSRKDNNAMRYMAEKLEDISKRITNEYQDGQ